MKGRWKSLHPRKSLILLTQTSPTPGRNHPSWAHARQIIKFKELSQAKKSPWSLLIWLDIWLTALDEIIELTHSEDEQILPHQISFEILRPDITGKADQTLVTGQRRRNSKKGVNLPEKINENERHKSMTSVRLSGGDINAGGPAGKCCHLCRMVQITLISSSFPKLPTNWYNFQFNIFTLYTHESRLSGGEFVFFLFDLDEGLFSLGKAPCSAFSCLNSCCEKNTEENDEENTSIKLDRLNVGDENPHETTPQSNWMAILLHSRSLHAIRRNEHKNFGNRMINQIMNENRKRAIASGTTLCRIVSLKMLNNTPSAAFLFLFGSDRCLTKSREFWSTTSARTPWRSTKRIL